MSSLGTLADLRRRLASVPWEPHGLQLLGLHPAILENPSVAHSWLTRARASLGADPGLLSNLGELSRRLESFREAIRYQRSALALNPSLPAAMSNLGQVHVECREASLGLPWLRRAIGLDPGSHAAAFNRVGTESAEFRASSICTLGHEIVDEKVQPFQPGQLVIRQIRCRPYVLSAPLPSF